MAETEAEFLKNYSMKEYPSIAVTVDLTIFTIRNESLCVLLVERGGHPEKGKWALPGGFINVNESLLEAAERELKEETGLTLEEGYLEQLSTVGNPHRDPRGYVVSVSYVALAPNVAPVQAGDDASQARFFSLDDVLAEDFELAFDHREIIEAGLQRVRAKLEYAPLAPKFLADESFTISELRRIYEIVWGVSLNTSNFRRKVKGAEGFLVPVFERRASQVQGGRSSDLYKLGSINTIYPPLRQQKAE